MPNDTPTARTAFAIKLARTAAPESGASDNERATATDKLASFCAEHNLSIADVIAAAAQPDAPAIRKPKPAADAPKPEAAAKPSKPHADAPKPDADEREALVAKLRAAVAALYNGPSLAVRGNPKRVAASAYSDLFAAPKHRTTLARVSERDESALFLVIKHGGAGATFDPVNLNFDLGIFSRLRSVGYIEAAPASAKLPYRLTKAAIVHAGNAAKRAA